MKITKETGAIKERFRQASNKLLNSCFLLKQKEETRKDYYFVEQNQDMFQEYFELLGYDLIVNRDNEFVAVVNQHETGRLRLKVSQTIFLLVLRILYMDRKKELRLEKEVVIKSLDIQDKWGVLEIDKKTNLDKSTLKDFIRLFKKYNLIHPIDTDPANPESRIILYPTLNFAVSKEALSNGWEKIQLTRLNDLLNSGSEVDDEKIN